MHKRLRGIFIWRVILGIMVFLGLWYAHAAQERRIDYFPSTVEMDHKESTTPIMLEGLQCEGDLFQKLQFCKFCQFLKNLCPDCCLSWEGGQPLSIKCSEQDTSSFDGCHANCFNCGNPLFDVSSCQQASCTGDHWTLDCSDVSIVPGCQREGCPDPQPNGNCQAGSETEEWLCKEDNLEPVFEGCSPQAVLGASWPDEVYRITDSSDPDYPYLYTLTSQAQTYINLCEATADSWEECANRVTCCLEDRCQGEETCPEETCNTRISLWTQGCSQYQQGCDELQQQVNEAMLSGDCEYVPMASDFYYDFVAKSRENIALLWQINSFLPREYPNVNTFLFAKLGVYKIEESGLENEVYIGPVVQRSLKDNFTIFSSALVPSTITETGYKYRIRILYFLPDLSGYDTNGDGHVDARDVLRVIVSSMRLTVIRIRE